MGQFGFVALVILLTVAIVLVAIRLRRTTSIGGSVQLKDASGDHLSIDDRLAKEVAASGIGKPVVTISMTTRSGGSGTPQSSEAITIDGQTYHSVEEIPPEIRERLRTVLAKARTKAGDPAAGAGAALVRIEGDLAALGLDLHQENQPSQDPPSTG